MLEFYGRKFTCDECPICEGIEHRVRVAREGGYERQMVRSSGICWYLLWLSRILDFYGRFNCCARHYGYHSSTNVCRV